MTEELDNEPWFGIEQRLRDDIDGHERDALLQRLDTAARAVKRRMDAGATPAEFAELNTIYHGFESASKVVETVWRSSHKL
jgi:hypothetical protein